jgi:hypothetical protein
VHRRDEALIATVVAALGASVLSSPPTVPSAAHNLLVYQACHPTNAPSMGTHLGQEGFKEDAVKAGCLHCSFHADLISDTVAVYEARAGAMAVQKVVDLGRCAEHKNELDAHSV